MTLNRDQLRRVGALYNDAARFRDGDRADVRRAKSPDELLTRPSFYRLAEYANVHQQNELEPLARIVWLLPAMAHRTGASPVGRVLRTALYADSTATELVTRGVRLRQLLAVRNGDSTGLVLRLRKLLTHAAQKSPGARFDVGTTGIDVLFWGDAVRRRWAQDMYLLPSHVGEARA